MKLHKSYTQSFVVVQRVENKQVFNYVIIEWE